jgi:NAD(P)-dependent dehydrogenase (short-subunit alcohol dehydrogenase family)
MVTNALSPMRIIEELGDLVRPGGTIGIMSSSMGSVALNETGGWEVYRASKAALNTLMRSYAVRHARDGRSLALVDPGWVRTDMGGSDASISVEESIPGVADALEARMTDLDEAKELLSHQPASLIFRRPQTGLHRLRK